MTKTLNSNANIYEVNKVHPLNKLFGYLKKYRINLILGVILGSVGVILRLFAPLLIREISTLIVKGDFNYSIITGYALGAMALFIGGSVLDFINIHLMISASAKSCQKLRQDIMFKINHLPLNYFDTKNIGDVLSFVTNDVDTVNTSLTLILPNLVASVVQVFGIIIILFILNWKIALVALVAIPVALLLLSLVGNNSEKQFVIRQDALSELSSNAEETYTAYNIVRIFRANKRFKDTFAKANLKLESAAYKADFLSGMMEPLTSMIGNVMVATICLVGAGVAARIAGSSAERASTISLIVAAVTYGGQLISPLAQMAMMLSSLSKTSAASFRIFSLLDEPEEPDESTKTLTIPKVEGNIVFDHVRFGYVKDRVIIHDFSETGKKGQKIAIVGPTGAGKTTMVNLLMRFYEINNGRILIDDYNTKDMNRSYVRSLFGMVLQDTWLFNGTIMENLKFSRRDATDEEVYTACKATHCDNFIRQMAGGYNAMITEECGLSSGQKQLLTIARAMVQNAPMLILDEATSSVDTRTELLIQDAMDKLMKGRTSFVIAHRLSTIKNSNLILVMKDGDVIESGSHEELMKKHGFYSNLYNSQFASKKN